MNKKKLLFGLIEMNRIMYNVLYTLLCVCVLMLILITFSYTLVELKMQGLIKELNWWYSFMQGAVIVFIGYKIMDKKHYA